MIGKITGFKVVITVEVVGEGYVGAKTRQLCVVKRFIVVNATADAHLLFCRNYFFPWPLRKRMASQDREVWDVIMGA